MCLLLPLLLSSCSDYDSYFLVGNGKQRADLRQQLLKVEEPVNNHEARYIINQQILNTLYAFEETEKINLYLTTYVQKHPDDPYNTYYLLRVADNYREAEAFPFAVRYYDRILKNHGDLLLAGRPAHYICLQNLIDLVDDSERLVVYYKDLLERFGDKIDRGTTNYYLAKTYERLGQWDLAMQKYKEFLNFPETVIPDNPEAHRDVQAMVRLYDLPKKNWTMENLDELVRRIKGAIWSQNSRLLSTLRSKTEFFARAWEEEDSEQELALLEDLAIFLQRGIRSATDLDRDSNEKEAYLRTTGWGFRIRTWFLYFQKINFPADPDIHGQWEWAGIYLGEKPY